MSSETDEQGPLPTSALSQLAPPLKLSTYRTQTGEAALFRHAICENDWNKAADFLHNPNPSSILYDTPEQLKYETTIAHVNAPDHNGSPPLHIAVRKGHHEMVQFLLSHHASVASTGSPLLGRPTPLHIAAGNHNLKIVALLLQASADINARDDYQRTPLHYAVLSKDKTMIEYLISKGADPLLRDDEGKQASYWAQKLGLDDAHLTQLLPAQQYDLFQMYKEQPWYKGAIQAMRTAPAPKKGKGKGKKKK